MIIKRSLTAQISLFLLQKCPLQKSVVEKIATVSSQKIFVVSCEVVVVFIKFLAMGQYTKEERVFMVKNYLEIKSPDYVIDAFRNQFPNRNVPSRSTIYRNVTKYSNEGTSLNLNKGRSGSRRTVRNQQNIAQVRQALLANPHLSTRRNNLQLTQSSIHRIIHNDLKWHPYKIHVRHELKPQDFARRVRFCRWFIDQCRNNRFLFNVVIGDEAAFQMNGQVNTHNVRQYAPRGQQPSFNFDRRESREKLSVWVGFSGNGSLLGPFFFDGNVNGRKYLEMFNNEILPAVLHAYNLNVEADIQNIWWFQDGAPPHRLREVTQRLRAVFRHNLVALHENVEWPARSPDLTPLDFFLWGYLKSKVYTTPPVNLQDLRARIIRECNILRGNQFIRNSMRAMLRKANLCIARNGQHVEGF